MNTPKKLKLMTDYQCWCLWDTEHFENVDPNTLPISSALKQDLSDWEDRFEAILNWEDPAKSGFPTLEDRDDFNETGWALFYRLKSELPEVEFTYFDQRLRKAVSTRRVS